MSFRFPSTDATRTETIAVGGRLALAGENQIHERLDRSQEEPDELRY
jgi:hypothetical protein